MPDAIVTGYTGADDGKPLSPEFRKLFPDQAAQGGEAQTKRTKVPPTPDRKGKRLASKTVTTPAAPGPYKKSKKSAPGGQAQPSRTKKQQGK